jgi:hypothetical protein
MQSEWRSLVTLQRATLAIDPTLRRRHATSSGHSLAGLRFDVSGMAIHASGIKPVDAIRHSALRRCHSVADLQLSAQCVTYSAIRIRILGFRHSAPPLGAVVWEGRRREAPPIPINRCFGSLPIVVFGPALSISTPSPSNTMAPPR